MTEDFQDITYTAPDGLHLYARDYNADSGGQAGRPVLLCMLRIPLIDI